MIGATYHREKLRDARRAAGISQKRFATEVGCHISTVVRSDTGNSTYVSVEMAHRFVAAANRLGILIDGRPLTIDDLVTVAGCPVCAERAAAESRTENRAA